MFVNLGGTYGGAGLGAVSRRRVARRSRGMSAYPTDSYYDPDRPSWLPYWIDDPTESLAKYNASNLLQATANAAGTAAGSVVGTVADSAASAVSNTLSSAFGSISGQNLLILGAIAAGILFIPTLTGARR